MSCMMHSACSAFQLTNSNRKAEKAMVKARASRLRRPEMKMDDRPRPCQYLGVGEGGGVEWSGEGVECGGEWR